MRVNIIQWLCLCVALSAFAGADTLKLSSDGQWAPTKAGSMETDIVAFKQAVNAGRHSQAQKLAVQLKKNYPQLSGGDFDAFADAEIFYAKKKYLKAARKYKNFTEQRPESIFFDAAIERLYDISVLFLNGQKVTRLGFLRMRAYEEAAELIEYIADRTGDAPIAQRAMITLAKSYEKRGEYLDAYHCWSEITSKWPAGKLGRESLIGMARSLHSSYRGPEYASKNLESAKSYYKDIELRYPELSPELEIQSQINLIEEQKAFKEYEVAKYYERTGDKSAAGMYYQSVIDEWPKSAAAQLAKRDYRNMQTHVGKKKRRGPVQWWFFPENEEKMFFVKLPD